MKNPIIIDDSLAYILGLECAAIYQRVKEKAGLTIEQIESSLPCINPSKINKYVKYLTGVSLFDFVDGRFIAVSMNESRFESEFVYDGVFRLSEAISTTFDLDQGGVYLIDDKYIGVSHSIKTRITSHIQDSIKCRHQNRELQSYIRGKFLSNQKLEIKVLSTKDSFEEESFWINYYLKQDIRLLNIIIPKESSNRICSEVDIPF